MTVESTRKTMTEYGQALLERRDFAQYFAPDVSLTIMDGDQVSRGAEAVEGLIRYLHEQAFDANPEFKGFTCEDGRCALEAVFAGKHTGEFAGVSATGREVSVPYSVLYDLEDDHIKELRIYMPMGALMKQITVAPAVSAG